MLLGLEKDSTAERPAKVGCGAIRRARSDSASRPRLQQGWISAAPARFAASRQRGAEPFRSEAARLQGAACFDAGVTGVADASGRPAWLT